MQRFDLQQSAQFPDLWMIAAADCQLTDDQVYHYWFEVTDLHPNRTGQRIQVTDPLAFMVDWRLRAPQPPGPAYTGDDRYPASVVKYSQGELIPCDAGGETGGLVDPPPAALPPNNRIVIYELPACSPDCLRTSWPPGARAHRRGCTQAATATAPTSRSHIMFV